MGKLIKSSFQILVKNSAIMQPIIFFTLFILIFNIFIGPKILGNPIIAQTFSILAMLLLTAFLSGWFYTIKYAVDNYKDFDKNNEDYKMQVATYNVETIKTFFTGVGEYFLPVLCLVIFNIIFTGFTIFVGQMIFGVSYFDIFTIQNAAELNPNLVFFILYLDLVAIVFHFLAMFWIPALYYKTKNPITSLFHGIVFLFRKFFLSLGIYIFIMACFFTINVFTYLSGTLPILSLIVFIILLYFVTYVFVLVFKIYSENCLTQEIVQEQMQEQIPTQEQEQGQDFFIKSDEEKPEENVE